MIVDCTRPGLVVLALVAAACVAPPPQPRSPESAAVAVTFDLSFTQGPAPRTVYFLRFDGSRGGDGELLESNYVNGEHAFLLEAPPGRYVAIAMFQRSSGQYIFDYLTYFTRDLVDRTEVTAEPGRVAYMGLFQIEMDRSGDSADAAAMASRRAIGGFANFEHAASLRRAQDDEAARERFVADVRGFMTKGGWGPMLE